MGAERLTEAVDRGAGELEAGGGAVAAERGQVRRAGLERRQQVEAGDAAPRAAAAALAVERDHDRGAVVALGEARGDDPDHARVPALPGDHQRRRLAEVLGQLASRRLGGGVDLALGRPPLAVRAAELGGDLGSRAPSSSVRKSSTPASAR